MIWYGFALGILTGAVMVWALYAHHALKFLSPDEVAQMTALAEVIRTEGYRGHPVSSDAVDYLLALATSYDHMVKLADKATELAK